MQGVFAAFCVAMLLIGNVVLILDTSGDLRRSDASVGVVAAGVAVIGVLSLAGGRIAVPSLDASAPALLVTSYRSRFFARLAWAEAPALFAFAGFLPRRRGLGLRHRVGGFTCRFRSGGTDAGLRTTGPRTNRRLRDQPRSS